MRIVYALPEDSPLRKKLKEPFGKIVKENELAEVMKVKELIAVGDACLASALTYGEPLIGVYDKMVERKTASTELMKKIDGWEVKKTVVKNPRGTITKEAIEVLRNAIKSNEKMKVEVEGEEDLLALLAIIHAKENMRVCYGQPGIGIVLVTPNEKTKETARKILKEMRM